MPVLAISTAQLKLTPRWDRYLSSIFNEKKGPLPIIGELFYIKFKLYSVCSLYLG